MLSYFGNFEESINVRTDNSLEEIWNNILRLSDISYLSQQWNNQDQINYIYVTTSLKQSYEYYKASKNLTLNTRPLLLYYCFLNLTKAILFMLSDRRPSDYHGLCKEDISKDISVSTDLLSFSAEVNNGVFNQLAEHAGYQIQLGKRLTLEDFISCIVELQFDFRTYFNKLSSFVNATVKGFSNGDINIIFEEIDTNEVVKDEIKKTFLEDKFEIVKEDTELVLKYNIEGVARNYKLLQEKAAPLLAKYFTYSVYNDERNFYYIGLRENKIPPVNAYFGIMYILSSIVRYKPEHLYKLINNSDTSISWFINRICDVSERVFPNLMLNILFKSRIKYGPYF